MSSLETQDWKGLSPFYRFRDEFFWPCMSGEQLPPTFSNSNYGAYLGRPTVRQQISGLGSQWLKQPRQSPLTPSATKMTIDLYLAMEGVNSGNAGPLFFAYGPNTPGSVTGPAVRILVHATTAFPFNVDLETSDNVGVQTSASVGTIPDTNWHEFTLVLTETAVTLSIDGVLKATNSTRVFPSNTGSSIDMTSGQNVSPMPTWDLSQLKVDYS